MIKLINEEEVAAAVEQALNLETPVTLLAGGMASGKTETALRVANEVCIDGSVAFLDTSHEMYPTRMRQAGLPLEDSTRVALFRPSSFDEAMDIASVCLENHVELIVVDDFSLMSPRVGSIEDLESMSTARDTLDEFLTETLPLLRPGQRMVLTFPLRTREGSLQQTGQVWRERALKTVETIREAIGERQAPRVNYVVLEYER